MGHLDKEALVTELKNYVTTMKERYPDAEHPPVEWLSASISMILLDQGQSATAPPAQSGIAAFRNLVQDEVSQPIANLQWRLDEHSKRHTIIELNSLTECLFVCSSSLRFMSAMVCKTLS